jgi:PadR family transcriptional regulator, regulatory protein PadR
MADETELDLLRGTLDLLILKAVAWQPLHGYAIAKWIKGASREALGIEDRALYIALHRLEARKLIKGKWEITSTGRRAKSYALTEAGRLQLAANISQWKRYIEAIEFVLTAPFAPDHT